jgi:hypothetical protein
MIKDIEADYQLLYICTDAFPADDTGTGIVPFQHSVESRTHPCTQGNPGEVLQKTDER